MAPSGHRGRSRTLIGAALAASVAAGSLAAAGPDEPSLNEVVRRMGAYVESYGEKASIVVGTERYAQETSGSADGSAGKRVLVSDFAIVKADAIRGWLGFRDVLEVDGARVSDRQERLATVLMASQGRYDEARRLSDESARFNIGSILRNFNEPTAVLFYFRPANLERFKFTVRSVVDENLWEIGFDEQERPTLIRTPEGEPVPSAGSVWVKPADGTILRTFLKIAAIPMPKDRGQRGSGRVDVTYRRVEALDMWLPWGMTEFFETSRQSSFERINGHAEYSNYRQFQTTVRIK
jgi:hypothetical protein